MNTIEYWKERCRLAEELLMETPHSLSETEEQKLAHDRWNEFKTLPIPDVKRRNYDLLLSEMGGDEQKTRVCLKYLSWLIKDIEIFKDVNLQDYKDIWEGAFTHSCA